MLGRIHLMVWQVGKTNSWDFNGVLDITHWWYLVWEIFSSGKTSTISIFTGVTLGGTIILSLGKTLVNPIITRVASGGIRVLDSSSSSPLISSSELVFWFFHIVNKFFRVRL